MVVETIAIELLQAGIRAEQQQNDTQSQQSYITAGDLKPLCDAIDKNFHNQHQQIESLNTRLLRQQPISEISTQQNQAVGVLFIAGLFVFIIISVLRGHRLKKRLKKIEMIIDKQT